MKSLSNLSVASQSSLALLVIVEIQSFAASYENGSSSYSVVRDLLPDNDQCIGTEL